MRLKTVGNFENLDPAIQNRIYALRSDKAKELVKSKIESVCEGYVFYGFHDPVAVVLEDGTVTCLYRADITYPNGETTDSVDYYIIFNRDSVDDSYIGGYEEQGLTKEVNGITVHRSFHDAE